MLPGCLFKFIQKQPPKVFILLSVPRYVGKLKWKELFLEISHKIHKENTCVLRVSFLKSIKKETLAHLFSCKFSQLFFHRTILQSWRLPARKCCFFLLIFLSPSLGQLPSQLARYSQVAILYSLCLLYNLAIFYDSCSYLSSLFFLCLKLNLFPAFHLCSVLPFLQGSFCRPHILLQTKLFYTALLIKKYETLFSRLFLAPSERNQNIQDNSEYNSVLPFRIILKIFVVNMLIIGPESN